MRRILSICGLVLVIALILAGSGCSSKTAGPMEGASAPPRMTEPVSQKSEGVSSPSAPLTSGQTQTDQPTTEGGAAGPITDEPSRLASGDASFSDDGASFMDDDTPPPAKTAANLKDGEPSFEDESSMFMDDEDEKPAKVAAATQQVTPQKEPWAISDPLEPWNRLVFSFNHFMYTYILDPIITAYTTIFPAEIRQLVSNFFYNLSMPIRFVASFMQGRFDKAFWEVSRFAVNSTVGFFGFADAASILGMPKPSPEDFGQMFGKWGFGHGPYIVWPFLGANSLRDTTGLVSELLMVDPVVTFSDDQTVVLTYLGFKWFHQAAGIMDTYHEMTDMAIDPYSAVRDFYAQYRWRLLND